MFNNSTQKSEAKFEEPNFGVNTFYFIIFGWMCLASFSFYLINNHSHQFENLFSTKKISKIDNEEDEKDDSFKEECNNRVKCKYDDAFLLVCLGLISCEMYTLIPTLQSYAGLSYSQVRFLKRNIKIKEFFM